MARIALVLLLACLSCDRGANDRARSEVLAVVAGQVITSRDLANRIAKLPEGKRPRDRAARQRLLYEMIDEQVMIAEATVRRLDRDPQVRRTADEILAQARLERMAASQAIDPRAITAADIESYYQRNRHRYEIGERRRVQAIAFADAASARRARAEPRLWDPFAPVAGERVAGHVGPLEDAHADAKIPEPLRRAVLALEQVGDVSEPIAHEHRHWLVRYAGRTAPSLRPLGPEVDNIRRILVRERIESARREIIAALRAKTQVTVDRDAVSSIDLVRLGEPYDPKQWLRDEPEAF